MGADTVFISYSHDSPEHSERVLALANKLRALGVDAELDQYNPRPPQGWPRWCEEQLRPENSKLVLVVCTPTYRDRVENRIPADEGRGVYWEGGIVYAYIYRAKANERFLPVLFGDESDESVPVPLLGFAQFRIRTLDLSDPGFEALCRELIMQPAVVRPAHGAKVVLGTKTPPLPEKPALAEFAPPAPPPVDRYAPISDPELDQIRREQRQFLDALLAAQRTNQNRTLGGRDALEVGRKVGLKKPIYVCEYLHYWAGQGKLDKSWASIATELQSSLGSAPYQQIEADFPPGRDKIFISYSHLDRREFEQLKIMLAPATRSGELDVWDDTKISPGIKWNEAITTTLRSTKVAVLLVSANFLQSDFINKHEFLPLLKASEDEWVTVFWIYLSPCLYELTEISQYQAAHDIKRALSQLDRPSRQAVLSQVCRKLVQLARN